MPNQDSQNPTPESQELAVDNDSDVRLQENQAAPKQANRAVDFLFDIPLELTVEVGRCSMPMGELINIMPGDIIELNTPAGEKIDVLANGKLVAKGEAVLVGERYGVRVLEIIENNSFQKVMPTNDGGVA